MLGGGALGNLRVHFLTDVLCSGVWEVLKDFQEPELKSLVAALQSTVLASRASATTGKYVYAFLRWKRWRGYSVGWRSLKCVKSR